LCIAKNVGVRDTNTDHLSENTKMKYVTYIKNGKTNVKIKEEMKMKTIKETKQVYVPKHEDIVMFETIDGKKFSDEKEAIKHEENLMKRKELEDKFKTKNIIAEEYGIDYPEYQTSSKLLYIEELNDDVKKDLTILYPYLAYSRTRIDNVKVGWNFFIETEYDSNSLGKWSGYELYIYQLENIIKEKEEQLKKLKDLV